MEFIESIGVRLREEREALGMSQTEFAAVAEKAGVSGSTRQSQSLYEKGKRAPDAGYLAAIAAVGADVLYILTGQRDGPPPIRLAADEQVLLDGYRGMDKATQKRMLAFVLEGDMAPKRQGQVFHGEVGQVVKTKKLDQKGISFFGKGKKE